jgi:limonene-1,2-epoxide hydrolase
MDSDRIVRDFCAAWGRGDLEAIMAAFTDDAVYHNIPMPPCNGSQAIRDFISGFLQTSPNGIRFDIHHQVANGNLVMNERVDTLIIEGRTIELPVCGVFELTPDGKISGWRDYFDMAQFTGT